MNRPTRIRISVTLIGFALIGLVHWSRPNAVFDCPSCRDGLIENGSAATNAVSILLMMAAPVLILTGWGTVILRFRAKRNIVLIESDLPNHY